MTKEKSQQPAEKPAKPQPETVRDAKTRVFDKDGREIKPQKESPESDSQS